MKEKINNRGELVKISDEKIIHQIKNVFRLKSDDRLVVFDGRGIDFECKIIDADKNNFRLEIISQKEVFVPKKQITLFLSVIKKENFELVCEKVTELGVTKIVPVLTERTLVKNLNRDRIEKILIEASEQCGRGDVPVFGQEQKLESVLDTENIFVCDIGGEKIRNLKTKDSDIGLLVGPEGGWSESERFLFQKNKLPIVSLGDTVLRAETAGIVATAFISL